MKTTDKIEIGLQLLTFILGVPSAGFMVCFATFFLLLPGLINFHPVGILWGMAALAGTVGLWRFVIGANNQLLTAGCLGGGIFAVLPFMKGGFTWEIWPVMLPLFVACLDLIWMGMNACFEKKKSTGEKL